MRYCRMAMVAEKVSTTAMLNRNFRSRKKRIRSCFISADFTSCLRAARLHGQAAFSLGGDGDGMRDRHKRLPDRRHQRRARLLGFRRKLVPVECSIALA